MKTAYTLLILLFAITVTQAQIIEEERSMSEGANNSLSIEIPDADIKTARTVWRNFVKKNTKNTKVKKVRKTDLLFCDNAEISAIGGANTVDIYLRLAQTGENTTATLWFDLGGAYLNSAQHGDKYTEGEKFLMRYALAVARATTQQELKNEEKKGKKLNKELSSLKKKNESYHKAIENAKATITKMESNIEQNVQDQEATTKAIEEQTQVIDNVKKRLNELEE